MVNTHNFIDQIKPLFNEYNPQFQTLDIALGFDNNYAMPAGVAMLSVIENTPNYNLNFHLFIDKVSEENIQKFKELRRNNISITLYYLNNNFKINPKTLVLHITTISTCIRFIMPEILESKTNRLIYLDSDVICLQSLAKLSQYNIENYIAGVITDTKDMQQTISKMYQIDSTKYFNAGVLLINTKKWCEENITKKALELINDGNVYKFADQDVLNILLENRTLLLPVKFNTKIKISIDAHQEKDIRPYTVILHYISQNKPWFKVYQSKIFDHYFQLSPWKNETLPLSGNSSSIRNYAKYLMKQGAQCKSIYYYGVYLKYKLFQKK
ncbi:MULTISPECIES: glycosyltransferase [unclassified Gilliamella]|uniref:glycosyltransferase family 8 protein n=1 Tax=unclassified Gilliamella TaxID=2685620 RepID=UPI0018DEB4DF|nr:MULTISPECIES: glycosyltransferase [unclassified Gilliamella]MBI0029130.1 glycosyltransferase family 8 protein [Gilliamella sp. B14448G7]MBI0030830.1 glycosyltransferase family 8 protein [Gilliamella sp. B14384G15]MBI0036014.1 glycosyltransferase family 8 protein [Gilliamella sp. B14448G11]MBI0043325.1 glycosyltransferase family 8 protein [Gilliamella sp. B14448G12]MBI0058171.1 glycosyltransferase family 8 protein [Gilliamella sp. B14384G12]